MLKARYCLTLLPAGARTPSLHCASANAPGLVCSSSVIVTQLRHGTGSYGDATDASKFHSHRLGVRLLRSLRARDPSLPVRSLRLAAIVSSALPPSPPLSPGADAPPDNGVPQQKVKVVPRVKTQLSYDGSVKSSQFITPLRAMREFMLSVKDLEELETHTSRSPYASETLIKVYLRTDIENKAYDLHGGQEAFEYKRKRMMKKETQERAYLFNFKNSFFSEKIKTEQEASPPGSIWSHPSGRIVVYAIVINGINVAMKGGAWWYTGSKSMFSETMHSLADMLNQVILAWGLYSSQQMPDEEHPYGFLTLRNVSSLISGVGIFFLGSVLSFYQFIEGLSHPQSIEGLNYALLVMVGSLVSEGGTLLLALNHAYKSATTQGVSLREYVITSSDPSTTVVLLEDAAAVLGVLMAAGCMSMTYLTGNPIYDTCGALGVSALLASVAGLIVYSNTQTLIGRSIPRHQREAIMRVMERHKIIRGSYDIKATTLGSDMVRFKAEVDIDGRELTRRYLETLQLSDLLHEMQTVQSEEAAVEFLSRHGENIVNILGAEINQIEASIKKAHPSVKHIDIEIN